MRNAGRGALTVRLLHVIPFPACSDWGFAVNHDQRLRDSLFFFLWGEGRCQC